MVVLIDEAEAHLHPKWQREVIPALLATFPHIQFLVSTHSPQVLSRVDSEDIFLLKDGEVLKLSSNPKGMDTNAILEEVDVPTSWTGGGRLPTGDDGLEQTRIVTAIERAAKTGETVQLRVLAAV